LAKFIAQATEEGIESTTVSKEEPAHKPVDPFIIKEVLTIISTLLGFYS